MTARLVVLAVALLAAVAAADTVRGLGGDSEPQADRAEAPAPDVALHDAGGYTPGGRPPTRVLRDGRIHLDADEIRRGFPPSLRGVQFAIGDVASAPDGTVAVAVYNFATGGPPANAIQLWRRKRLVASFPVPPGTFGGGIGFTADGRIVARGPDGRTTVFARSRGETRR